MIRDLINIIKKVKEKITDSSDVVWTRYNTAGELRLELDKYISELQNGEFTSLEIINGHFLPTSTFQEHSISNDWPDEYIKLSKQFDDLYEQLKKS